MVKRGTQAHLGLQDPQERRAPLERMELKGTWDPRGSQEIQDPLETLEFWVWMVPQGREETLVMLEDRVLLVLLGNPAPGGPLARGVLLATWGKKAEKGRKVPRGSQVLMVP